MVCFQQQHSWIKSLTQYHRLVTWFCMPRYIVKDQKLMKVASGKWRIPSTTQTCLYCSCCKYYSRRPFQSAASFEESHSNSLISQKHGYSSIADMVCFTQLLQLWVWWEIYSPSGDKASVLMGASSVKLAIRKKKKKKQNAVMMQPIIFQNF